MARFLLEPLGEAAILDGPEWARLRATRPPEASPSWIRYACSEASGFGLTEYSIASFRADDGALAVAVVGDDGPFTPGDPQGLRVGDPVLEASWLRYAETHRDARGFESWLPRSVYHGFLRDPGPAGDRCLTALLDRLVEHVRSAGYSYLLVRYLDLEDQALVTALRQRGAIEIPTRPGTRLRIDGSREGWLHAIPATHRRQIGQRWRKFEAGGGRMVTVPALGAWADRCLELHELTCAKFSTKPFLPEAFLRIRPDVVDGEFHLFFVDDRLDGFMFCLQGVETYAAKFGGIDPSGPNLWGILYQKCVEIGLARGAHTILTGPTGYEGKRYLGIDELPMSNFFLVLDPALTAEVARSP